MVLLPLAQILTSLELDRFSGQTAIAPVKFASQEPIETDFHQEQPAPRQLLS